MNIKSLESVGGKEWVVGDKHRLYFNDLDELFGLECWYHNSGNVRRAELNGEHISNCRATEIEICLSEGKLWYDVLTGKWSFRISDCRSYSGSHMASGIIKEILRRAAQAEA